MFTGLVQELGEIKSLSRTGNELRFSVDLKSLTQKDLQIGESIAINGSCHTLEKLEGDLGFFFSSAETLAKTNFGSLKIGDHVNLELSLTPSTRMGGHFVSGHVDSLAKLLSVQNLSESYLVHFEIPSQYVKYLVYKGSVCLNGISLTVASVENSIFSVAIIPHTWRSTNLQFLRPGTLLNFEADLLAKYLEKMLQKDDR